jgi:hypothetical protein
MKRESYLVGSTKTCPVADKYSPGTDSKEDKTKEKKRNYRHKKLVYKTSETM